VIHDLDGIELSSIHSALIHAMRTVQELRAEDSSFAADWQDWRLAIIDGSGQTVQVIPPDKAQWSFPSWHETACRPEHSVRPVKMIGSRRDGSDPVASNEFD
jgi:hypothetical protein